MTQSAQLKKIMGREKMNKIKYLIFLSPLFLSGCTFDTVQFVKNPVVMIVIGIITLYFVFRMKR